MRFARNPGTIAIHPNRHASDRLHNVVESVGGGGIGKLRPHHLDGRNQMRRRKKMQVGHALTRGAIARDIRNSKSGGVRADGDMARGRAIEFGEDLPFQFEPFGRGFEHEFDIRPLDLPDAFTRRRRSAWKIPSSCPTDERTLSRRASQLATSGSAACTFQPAARKMAATSLPIRPQPTIPIVLFIIYVSNPCRSVSENPGQRLPGSSGV